MSKVNPLYNEADITAYIQRVFYDVTPDPVSLLTVFHKVMDFFKGIFYCQIFIE